MCRSYADATRPESHDVQLGPARTVAVSRGSQFGGSTVKYHYPYKPADLLFDSGRRGRYEKPTCPDCNWADPAERERGLYDFVAPRQVNGRIAYGYRLCKVCGFMQPADGKTPPHRCWLSRHRCQPQGFLQTEATYFCGHCRKTFAVKGGVAEPHRCGKYLGQEEHGYVCSTCRQWFGRESMHPLPRKGSG